MVRFAGKWLDMIESLLPTYAREIDTSWLVPLNDLLRRAAEAGHGEHSIAALTEVLRSPASRSS